jgi:DNA-binding PadR family transcriptional regulator
VAGVAWEVRHVLPLKPLVFQALVVLADADRHGWSLVQELQRRNGGSRLLPGNLYRLLNSMVAEGLIDVVEPSPRERARAAADTGANAERRRYFGLTPFGREVARAEARRLEALVDESRRKRLITGRL